MTTEIEFAGHFDYWFRVKAGLHGETIVLGLISNSPEFHDGQAVRTEILETVNLAKMWCETASCRYTLGQKVEAGDQMIADVLGLFGYGEYTEALSYV